MTTPTTKVVKVGAGHPGFLAAKTMCAESRCKKQPVGAAVWDIHTGLLGAGSNDPNEPAPKRCPRVVEGCASGEGYWMCKHLCRQDAHAEVAAINHALECVPASAIVGSSLYIWGHDYSCDNCQAYVKQHGIRFICFPVDENGENPSTAAFIS